MPFPSTRVIPDAWSQHHQPVVEGAFNATIIMTDPSRSTPGQWDPDTGTYGPSQLYIVVGGATDPNADWREGVPCRIQRQRDDRAVDHAAQDIVIRLYLIQLPADVPDIEVGYRAEVLTCPNDPLFVGEYLTATDVLHGSERFNRDVAWVHNQQPRQE